ncbi:hypothetical protein HMPREF0322_01738 [Desulfitobacterium hafniense DP7]|uniref:Uncharacterized protein n=1 Tax=Desulfitobacterium hafniense DP7 TaxID=537010 RepID=G9XLA4_DESHA|nr:hypothetical protein HMPREF0322_01738 [Desulfitobacterium hafniense DP7]
MSKEHYNESRCCVSVSGFFIMPKFDGERLIFLLNYTMLLERANYCRKSV